MAIPLPATRLNPTFQLWPAGAILHRVHSQRFPGTEFNPGTHGQLTRFAPFADAQGQPVAYLYAAGSFECALFETLFHDVPVAAEVRVAPDLTAELAYTEVAFEQELKLAELTRRALPKLGLTRAEVIDSPASMYAHTVALAQRLWAETDCQGLFWISRQDDRAPCVLIFGDRAPIPHSVRAHGVIATSVALMTTVYQAAAAGNIVLASIDSGYSA